MTSLRRVATPSPSKGRLAAPPFISGSSTSVTHSAAIFSPSRPFSSDSPFCAASALNTPENVESSDTMHVLRKIAGIAPLAHGAAGSMKTASSTASRQIFSASSAERLLAKANESPVVARLPSRATTPAMHTLISAVCDRSSPRGFIRRMVVRSVSTPVPSVVSVTCGSISRASRSIFSAIAMRSSGVPGSPVQSIC